MLEEICDLLKLVIAAVTNPEKNIDEIMGISCSLFTISYTKY